MPVLLTTSVSRFCAGGEEESDGLVPKSKALRGQGTWSVMETMAIIWIVCNGSQAGTALSSLAGDLKAARSPQLSCLMRAATPHYTFYSIGQFTESRSTLYSLALEPRHTERKQRQHARCAPPHLAT